MFVQKLENTSFLITWGRVCTLNFLSLWWWVVKYGVKNMEFSQDMIVLNQWAKQWKGSFKVDKSKLTHLGIIIETTYMWFNVEQGTSGKRSGNKCLCHCWRISENISSVPVNSQKKEASKIVSITGKGIEKKENHIFL